MKERGLPNNLIDLLAADPAFGMTDAALRALFDPKGYIGRCPEQVTAFLETQVEPILKQFEGQITREAKLDV